MKRTSIFRILCSVMLVLSVLITMTAHSQEKSDTHRNKNIFVEFGGSGAAIWTVNFDTRFNKGSNDGWGVRLGAGGGSTSSDPILGEGDITTKLFSVPLEVNYILGKGRFSFEIGGSVAYISIKEERNYSLFGIHQQSKESENVLVSYLPIGIRLKPQNNGFMLKANIGPLWNFSAPNLYSDNSVNFWGGLALGYSFY